LRLSAPPEVVQTTDALKTDFEDEIRSFLSKLEFNPVMGGPQLILHAEEFGKFGMQVDALAGHEDTLLIIECLTRQKLGKGVGLDEEIWIWAGKRKAITQAIKLGKDYPLLSKFSNLVFIIATRNFQITEAQEAKALENGIYLWTDAFFEYYDRLFNVIGDYAKYNLLGELGVKPKISHLIEVPAFKIKLGENEVFAFFALPKDLLKFSYVARREVGKEQYYQRIVREDKVAKIREYLKNGGFFPNSIILSITADSKFTVMNPPEVDRWPGWVDFGWLQFPQDYRSCWIIDGQHRLYGSAHAGEEKHIPVVAFSNLPIKSQGSLFLTINKNQKPVEKELLWDLNGDMLPTEEDGIISNAVKLVDLTEGALFNKFYIPFKGPKKRGQLRFSTPCIALRRMNLAKPFLRNKIKNELVSGEYQKTTNNIAKIFASYFQLLNDLVDATAKEEFLLTDSGMPIDIGFLEKIVSRARAIPSEEDLKMYVAALAKVFSLNYSSIEDFEDLRKQTTSFANQDRLIDLLTLKVSQLTNDPEFAQGIEALPLNRIKKIENMLGRLIKAILDANTSSNNWLERVDGSIAKEAMKRMKDAGGKNLEEYLNLGEEVQIIQSEKNYPLFKDVFECRYGFGSKDETVVALHQIGKHRATFEAHYHSDASPKYKEDEIVRIQMDKVEKCIENIPDELKKTAFGGEEEEEEEESS
jgi:DGQHR domain-containing protein